MNREFHYVDEDFLTKRAEEIREDIATMCEALPVPKDARQSPPAANLSIEDKILMVEVFLERDICVSRPQGADEIIRPQNCRFVKETMLANKVVLPVQPDCPVRGLSSIAVWVSDPDPSLYTQDPYQWRGTFLYLTEVHWDRAGFSTAYSGVSALQALVNQMAGRDFFAYVNGEFEPYGRGRDLHPVDKLRELGGPHRGSGWLPAFTGRGTSQTSSRTSSMERRGGSTICSATRSTSKRIETMTSTGYAVDNLVKRVPGLNAFLISNAD